MTKPDSTWTVAVVLSVLAAFGWAAYYPLILAAGRSSDASAGLALPFLFGGAAYALYAASRGLGREFLGAFRNAAALGRTALLLGLQVSVLASTYLLGPVDAALLSLLGDVVATPLLVAYWLSGPRAASITPLLLGGLLLSLVGGTLAIVGGGSLQAIPPLGWLVVPVVPLTVAFYFVLSARATEGRDGSGVVAQSMFGAGLLALAISPLVPGGASGLLAVPPLPLALLAVNGVVSFFLAPLCYFRAIARVGLVLPPMLQTGIPVFTLVFSVIFLALVPTPLALLGIPVAVVGGALTLRSERRSALDGATASR